jgi:hypothetical protein
MAVSSPRMPASKPWPQRTWRGKGRKTRRYQATGPCSIPISGFGLPRATVPGHVADAARSRHHVSGAETVRSGHDRRCGPVEAVAEPWPAQQPRGVGQRHHVTDRANRVPGGPRAAGLRRPVTNTKNNSTPTPWAARAVGVTDPSSAPKAADAHGPQVHHQVLRAVSRVRVRGRPWPRTIRSTSWSWFEVEHSALQGGGDRGGAAIDVELGIDVDQVGLDGGLADA